MSGSRRVVVVGGGVIGTACAHYLAESGWSVTMIERDRFGAACSHGNCGLVCPSHVLPLAEPGAVLKAVRALLQRNSPFTIRPRLDWSLWTWLLAFARRCNERDMMHSGRACQPLLTSTLEEYKRLVAAGTIDCEWEQRGLLFVYQSRAELDSYAKTDRILRETFDEPATRYDGEAVVQLEPALKPGLAGGWYYEEDAHLRPDKLLASWRRHLEQQGVVIHENCPLLGFVEQKNRACAVQAGDEVLTANAFVVATGALTAQLAGQLGCPIPIQPGKGYSLTMPRPAVCPQIPLIFPETRVAVTPMQSGYRLGSTMEFAGFDESIIPARLQLLKDGARPYLREPYCEPVLEEWYGWRPMTYDSVPIIDRCPSLENVFIAAGHNMLGLSMAAATGKLVAELLGGTPPHIDSRPYSLQRFSW